jgi:hypothetical protein
MLYKEYKQRKTEDIPKSYTWLKYLGMMLVTLFFIMTISYIFFKEQVRVILKSIIYVLHFMWLIGIIVWILKLNSETA